MKLKTLKRKEYWEALFIVRIHQFLQMPGYTYGWYKARLNLIKQDKI